MLSLLEAAGGADKGALLSQAASFVQTGYCASPVLGLIEQIGLFTEQILGKAIIQSLSRLSATLDITAVRNRVSTLEISNELYHLLFGSINETLVQRGLVSAPRYFPGEGRYAKCIVLD